MLLSIDGTFLVQILNFVVFWVLLNYRVHRADAPGDRSAAARTSRAVPQREAQAVADARAATRKRKPIADEARRAVDEAMRARGERRRRTKCHAIERKASDEAAATVALAHATVADERAQAIAKQGPFVDELARTMAQRALEHRAGGVSDGLLDLSRIRSSSRKSSTSSSSSARSGIVYQVRHAYAGRAQEAQNKAVEDADAQRAPREKA